MSLCPRPNSCFTGDTHTLTITDLMVDAIHLDLLFYSIIHTIVKLGSLDGLTYRMVRDLREKLKSHRESLKWTRVDAIIQIPPPPPPQLTITFQIKSLCL